MSRSTVIASTPHTIDSAATRRSSSASGRVPFDNYVSPWLALVDDARFQATVDRVQALQPTTMAGCHTPAISATKVAQAIAATRRSPTAEYEPEPDQATLELIQATFATAAA